jgi:hypothetical protein
MKLFCEGLRRNIVYSTYAVVCWKGYRCNKTNPFPAVRDSQFVIHVYGLDSDIWQDYIHRTMCCVNPIFYSIRRWSPNICTLGYGYVKHSVYETLYNISTEEYSFHEGRHNQGVDSNLNKYGKCALIS